jgi:hypothetical protein
MMVDRTSGPEAAPTASGQPGITVLDFQAIGERRRWDQEKLGLVHEREDLSGVW